MTGIMPRREDSLPPRACHPEQAFFARRGSGASRTEQPALSLPKGRVLCDALIARLARLLMLPAPHPPPALPKELLRKSAPATQTSRQMAPTIPPAPTPATQRKSRSSLNSPSTATSTPTPRASIKTELPVPAPENPPDPAPAPGSPATVAPDYRARTSAPPAPPMPSPAPSRFQPHPCSPAPRGASTEKTRKPAPPPQPISSPRSPMEPTRPAPTDSAYSDDIFPPPRQ